MADRVFWRLTLGLYPGANPANRAGVSGFKDVAVCEVAEELSEYGSVFISLSAVDFNYSVRYFLAVITAAASR